MLILHLANKRLIRSCFIAFHQIYKQIFIVYGLTNTCKLIHQCLSSLSTASYLPGRMAQLPHHRQHLPAAAAREAVPPAERCVPSSNAAAVQPEAAAACRQPVQR